MKIEYSHIFIMTNHMSKVTTWRHNTLEAIEVWLAISIEKQINNMANDIHLDLSKLTLCLKIYVFEPLNLGNTWNVKLTWLSMVGENVDCWGHSKGFSSRPKLWFTHVVCFLLMVMTYMMKTLKIGTWKSYLRMIELWSLW